MFVCFKKPLGLCSSSSSLSLWGKKGGVGGGIQLRLGLPPGYYFYSTLHSVKRDQTQAILVSHARSSIVKRSLFNLAPAGF